MHLDRFAVELRPRNGFESLDLGFAMFRAWRGALLRAWLVTYAPVALVTCVALWRYPSAAFLVVWWLKPLYDRVLLHVYSQAMFGVLPGTRDVLRALPQLLLRTRLVAGLTTFRFSMARSLFLAVWQLEGQRGAAARARRRVLRARTYGHAVWLTFVCANVASLWILGGLAIAQLLTPEDAGQWFSLANLVYADSDTLPLYHAMNVLAFVADTVIEPYYVGAGFSLYLNRRSELEGWDLEVEFRRMSERHAGARARLAPIALAAVVLGFALPHTEAHAAAADPAAPIRIETTPLPPGAVKREVKAV
ncbi:MAG: DUF4129 domain-containing protein, partial [Burkholderiales bacterium]|nr:DUF4129 domain-containing protein [Burkholderiales bacterium]